MKRGFTLIELLAVLTILTFILLTTIPVLTKTIDNSKEKAKISSIDLYGIAIENAVADYYAENPDKENVTLKELEDGNYLKYNGSKVECNEIQIAGRKVYLNDCKVGNKYVEHSYGKVTPQPELAPGLIPVEYDGNKWIVTEADSESWYNYDNQQWANAVTLLPGVIKDVGDEVKVDGTEASMMLVWIPRYEYKYTNLGDQYAGGTQTQPGEIKINFILSKRTHPSSKDYKVHPAFTFGDKNVSGFWVGKFEISHETLSESADENTLGCISGTCTVDSSKFRILPNVPSLRYNNVSNFWYGIKSIENESSFGLSNIDTHMIKNSEWGAVAYLSQSRYGKTGNDNYTGTDKEIYRNLSLYYITGNSNGAQFQDSAYTQCAYNQKIGNDTNQSKTNCGPGASTTGNVYGVYDMSGGSGEYAMGAYADGNYPSTSYSGFSNEFTNNAIDSKYYDIYKTTNLSTACENSECYGHALSEINGWYGVNTDNTNISTSQPWIARGGNKENPGKNSILYSNFVAGVFRNNVSTRFVGIVK